MAQLCFKSKPDGHSQQGSPAPGNSHSHSPSTQPSVHCPSLLPGQTRKPSLLPGDTVQAVSFWSDV